MYVFSIANFKCFSNIIPTYFLTCPLLFLLIGEYFIAPPTHPLQFRQLPVRQTLNVSLQLFQLFFYTSHPIPSVTICFQIFFLFIFLKYLKNKKAQKYKNLHLQC